MTQNEPPPPHDAQEQTPKKTELIIRMRNWLVDNFATIGVLLFVGFVFEHFADAKVLNEILELQKDFYRSAKSLNPLNISGYILEAFDFIFYNIDRWLNYLLPTALVNVLMLIFFLPLWAFILGFAWIILPLTILGEGNIFELLLVLLIFVPLAILMANGAGMFGIILAIFVTSLVYWLIQTLMIGVLFVFGEVVSLSAICAASSGIGTLVFWCITKKAEHSVTERLLHIIKGVFVRA